jgi:hypothetical protein
VRPTRAIGVGIFVLGGLLLFAVALFLVGDRRGLFSDSFVVLAIPHLSPVGPPCASRG